MEVSVPRSADVRISGEVQGRQTVRELETRVDLRVDAFLPADYVAEEKQRMEMYKRIASIVTDEDRADVTDELIDRYGELPEAAETLLDVSQLRALCNRLGVSQVSAWWKARASLPSAARSWTCIRRR